MAEIPACLVRLAVSGKACRRKVDFYPLEWDNETVFFYTLGDFLIYQGK